MNAETLEHLESIADAAAKVTATPILALARREELNAKLTDFIFPVAARETVVEILAEELNSILFEFALISFTL